ncbi:MAG: Smr/MutS family protein [Bacteroidota bacterium]
MTLDLHGVRYDDGEDAIFDALDDAQDQGVRTLKVIHGASTSSQLYRNRTLKHLLHSLLDAGSLDGYVRHAVRFEGHTLLSIRSGG